MNGNRHADPHMNSPTADFNPEAVEEIASSIETCVARRESLDARLSSLRKRKLRGEAVQSDLNEVFRAESALYKVALVGSVDHLELLLDAIEDRLSKEIRSEFERFWTRHAWIADGAKALRIKKNTDASFWTDASLDWSQRDGTVYVRHTMEWGVDEVHSIEAPLVVIWQDWLSRSKALLRRLVDADIQLSDEELEVLAESTEGIEDLEYQLIGLTSGEANKDEDSPELETLISNGQPEDDDARSAPDDSDSDTDDDGLIGFA